MKSVRRPNGMKHVVIESSDLVKYYSKSRAITDQIRKKAEKRIIEKGAYEYLVTFSENETPKWATLPAIIREIHRQWNLQQEPQKKSKKTINKKVAVEKVSVEVDPVYHMKGCSVDFSEYLAGYNGKIDFLKEQFRDDQEAFRVLWNHVKCYNDALYALQFILYRTHRVLLAMRAVVLAATDEQIKSARKKLPEEFAVLSTEKIERFMKRK